MLSEKYAKSYVDEYDELSYSPIHVDDELLEALPENIHLSLGDKLELKEILDNFCKEHHLAQIGG